MSDSEKDDVEDYIDFYTEFDYVEEEESEEDEV